MPPQRARHCSYAKRHSLAAWTLRPGQLDAAWLHEALCLDVQTTRVIVDVWCGEGPTVNERRCATAGDGVTKTLNAPKSMIAHVGLDMLRRGDRDMEGTFKRGEPACLVRRLKAKNSGALSCDASTIEPPAPDLGPRRKAR